MTFSDLPDLFVIFDLEYTTWEGAQERNWTGAGERREVVQMGAILVGRDPLREEGEFNRFIKPVLNPKLSEFFTDLTGITQEHIEREGISFPEALEAFSSWASDYPLYSWGTGDPEALKENSAQAGIRFPYEAGRFASMQEVFMALGVPAEAYTSGTIVRAFGKELSRRQHNALNDVRTILDGLRELKKRF